MKFKSFLSMAASTGVIEQHEKREILALVNDSRKMEPDSNRKRELLTLQETAAILKVHVKTVHEYIKAGHLEKIKLGAHASRIPALSLDAFLAERRTQGEMPDSGADR